MKTMIDTISLMLPMQNCEVIDKNLFYSYIKGYTKKRDYEGNYMPALELYRNSPLNDYQEKLGIRFSAPKMVFNNNLDELEHSDFDKLINATQEKLRKLGVSASKESLSDASVYSFHPSKNIHFSGYYTAESVIRDLHKISVNRKYDFAKIDFRNGGHSLQIYSKAHSLVVYDKITDLGKPRTKAIDREKTNLEREIFDKIQKSRRKRPLEILKVEVRLSQKKKMNEILEKTGFAKNPNFKDIFRQDVCQNIIKYYWKKYITEKNNCIFSLENNFEKDFDCFFNETQRKAKDIIFLLGLEGLIQKNGIETMRHKVEEKFGKSTWQSISRKIKTINEMSENKNPVSVKSYISDIDKTLNNFNSIQVNKLLNMPI